MAIWVDKAGGQVLPAVARRVRSLFGGGATDDEIADALGVSARTAKRVRGVLGLRRAASPSRVVHDAQIRDLHARGLTYAEISSETGLTHRSVQERAYRMGLRAHRRRAPEPEPLPEPEPPPEDLNTVIEALWREGRSDKEIALVVGISHQAVRRRRQRRGWSSPRTPVDRERLRQLWASGLSGGEIAEQLGCTHRTVQQLCWELGLALQGASRDTPRRR